MAEQQLNNRAKLYTKILNVVSKMEALEKSGYNNHQKYAYHTEEDLVNGIRTLLLENKLLILSSSEIKDVQKLNKPDKNSGTKETLVTVVTTRHKIVDAETGEFEEVTSSGTGWDDTDKGSFKAITGAMKYFISKNFLVPTKDDAENDGVTIPKTAAPPKTFGATPTSQVVTPASVPPIKIDNSSTKVEVAVAPTVAPVTTPQKVMATPAKFGSKPVNVAAAAPVTTSGPVLGKRKTTTTEPSFP